MATKRSTKKETLAGIWKGSQIDEELIGEAKKSVFPYAVNKGQDILLIHMLWSGTLLMMNVWVP